MNAVRALTDGARGADIVIEATGLIQVWETSVRMARKGGFVLLFGGTQVGQRPPCGTPPCCTTPRLPSRGSSTPRPSMWRRRWSFSNWGSSRRRISFSTSILWTTWRPPSGSSLRRGHQELHRLQLKETTAYVFH